MAVNNYDWLVNKSTGTGTATLYQSPSAPLVKVKLQTSPNNGASLQEHQQKNMCRFSLEKSSPGM
jgi:hypothetical protein